MRKNKQLHNECQVLDSFKREGSNDAVSLQEVVSNLTRDTEVFRLRGKQVDIYCVINDDDAVLVKQCPADTMVSGSGRFISVDNLKHKGGPMSEWPAELQEEAITLDRIFIGFNRDNGEYVFMPATSLLSSDFAMLGITGKAAQTFSYHLLGVVAELIQDITITLITRTMPAKSGTIHKCIGMRSEQYAYIPQEEAMALAFDVCSDGDLVSWNVTNFLTDVLFKFTQHTVSTRRGRKMVNTVPYIRVTTSDTGDSSFSFELGWDVNGNQIFLASGTNRVFKTHRGEWNSTERDALYNNAVKLKDKFTIFEDRMKELDTITVINENIERTVKNLCSDAKISSKNIQEAFVQHVTAEFAGTDATAAEIVLSMIEAQKVSPVLCDLSDNQISVMQHKLGEVPYLRIRQNA